MWVWNWQNSRKLITKRDLQQDEIRIERQKRQAEEITLTTFLSPLRNAAASRARHKNRRRWIAVALISFNDERTDPEHGQRERRRKRRTAVKSEQTAVCLVRMSERGIQIVSHAEWSNPQKLPEYTQDISKVTKKVGCLMKWRQKDRKTIDSKKINRFHSTVGTLNFLLSFPSTKKRCPKTNVQIRILAGISRSLVRERPGGMCVGGRKRERERERERVVSDKRRPNEINIFFYSLPMCVKVVLTNKNAIKRKMVAQKFDFIRI